MNQIDYSKTKEYWNSFSNKEEVGKYSSGYIIPSKFEEVAFYRFKKELNFLNKFGHFGGNYLDLGCGTGNFLFEWRDKYSRLIGIDFSDKFVEIANKQCLESKNISIFQDNALNFEKYVGDEKFNFIFLGGFFMYINDNDVSALLNRLFKKLNKGGVLIFREPTATNKRIYKENIGIRRTVDEYKRLIAFDRGDYTVKCYQNYSVNYTHLICLYFKLFPFLINKITLFDNKIVEFLFLYLPLKLYTRIKRNMVLYHFFVINKNTTDETII